MNRDKNESQIILMTFYSWSTLFFDNANCNFNGPGVDIRFCTLYCTLYENADYYNISSLFFYLFFVFFLLKQLYTIVSPVNSN